MRVGSKPDVGFILDEVTLEPNFLKVLQLFPCRCHLSVFYTQSFIHR